MEGGGNGRRVILVSGATGQQGGAVARNLLERGFAVRALTRDPEKAAARELADLGAEVVSGDLEDRASIERVLDGVYGVFSVQKFLEAGVEGEVRQGVRLADAAKAAGVEHYVYSSVGSAHRETGIPHFESKWEVEEHVRAAACLTRCCGRSSSCRTWSLCGSRFSAARFRSRSTRTSPSR